MNWTALINAAGVYKRKKFYSSSQLRATEKFILVAGLREAIQLAD
jgi:hypothetical protein